MDIDGHIASRSQLWYELVMRKTTPEDWKHFSVLAHLFKWENHG